MILLGINNGWPYEQGYAIHGKLVEIFVDEKEYDFREYLE